MRRHSVRAYGAASALRSQRDQDADIFDTVSGRLASIRDGNGASRTRAIADNRLLWNTVVTTCLDPRNPQERGLKASLVSVGKAVLREMEKPEPDFEFLLQVNGNIAAGLRGQKPAGLD